MLARKLLKDLDDEMAKLEKELEKERQNFAQAVSVLGAVLKQVEGQQATFSFEDWIDVSKDEVIIHLDSETKVFTVRYRPKSE